MAGAYLLTPFCFDIRTMFWLVAIIATLLIAAALMWYVRRLTRCTPEYRSGYAVNVQHHDAWVERLEHCVTMQDSNGYSSTHTEVEYRPHRELWLMELNTGEYVRISREAFEECAKVWGGEGHAIYPDHPNRISGGGGRLFLWNEVYGDSVTCTYLGEYVNHIRNANIRRPEQMDSDTASALGLIDYPEVDERYMECDVVLVSNRLSGRVDISAREQRALQLVNAHYGELKQIHIFVLLFDACDTSEIVDRQRAYWHGGGKNEFVVALGVDIECDVALVRWCNTFSWSMDSALSIATKEWFVEHPELNIEEFAEWLGASVDLWRRREFSEFEPRGYKFVRWLKRG